MHQWSTCHPVNTCLAAIPASSDQYDEPLLVPVGHFVGSSLSQIWSLYLLWLGLPPVLQHVLITGSKNPTRHGAKTICNNEGFHTWDPSALKWSRACFRSSPLMEPSSRWKLKCLSCKYSARMSNIMTIWEKMSTRWPPSFKRHSNLSNKNNFPLPWMSD